MNILKRTIIAFVVLPSMNANAYLNYDYYDYYDSCYSNLSYTETLSELSSKTNSNNVTYYDANDNMDNGLNGISTLATVGIEESNYSASRLTRDNSRKSYLTARATSYELPAFSRAITDNVHNIHQTLVKRISDANHLGSFREYEHGNWHKFTHFKHDYAPTKTTAPFVSKNYQYIFGYDLVDTEDALYGGSYGFTASDVSYELGKSKATINHHNFSLYGKYLLADNYSIPLIISCGGGRVNFEQLYNDDYTASNSVWTFNANAEIGLENKIQLRNEFLLAPNTSFGVDYSKVGGFTETHIHVPESNNYGVYHKLGCNIRKELILSQNNIIVPQLHYSYRYDISRKSNIKPIQGSNRVNAIFAPKNKNKGYNGHLIGFDLILNKQDKGSMSLGYSHGFAKNKHANHALSVNLHLNL